MRFKKLVTINWLHELLQTGQPDIDTDVDAGGAAPAYQRILAHIVAGFGADSGELALYDEVIYGNLEIVAATRVDAIGRSLTPGEGMSGWVAQHRRPVLLVDGAANEREFRASGASSKPDAPSKPDTSSERGSSMCWPLSIGTRVIGALRVALDSAGANVNADANTDTENPYTMEDLAEGGLMIDLMGMAIENTRLHAEQRRRIAALAQMGEQIVDANRKLNDAHKQLLQAEKMASVGQLAAGVAHEINNPIGFVQGNLTAFGVAMEKLFSLIDTYSTLEEALPPADERRKRLAEARRACDLEFLREDLPAMLAESRDGVSRVKSIVRHLQDFSNAEPEQDWESADAHACIDAAIELTGPLAGARIEVVREYGALPPLQCQPLKIRQMFINLITNAIQAMGMDPKGRLVISSQAEGGLARFEIRDTGHGIAPEVLPHIFDPFFTTRPVGQGTGLGLAMVYRLALEHGGSIEADSTPGRGTTFTLMLPLRQKTGVDMGAPDHARLLAAA